MFGENHKLTAQAEEELGFAFKMMGKSKKALECYEKVLKFLWKRLGENHPKTKIFLQKIKDILEDLDQGEKLIEFINRAKIFSK